MITVQRPPADTVDDFGKASTRPNCRKGNLKPSDHLKGSAVFMNEKSFKPEKSGKKVNISPQRERIFAPNPAGTGDEEFLKYTHARAWCSPKPADHLQGPYLIHGPPESSSTGRKSKGTGKPDDNLAFDKIQLDGRTSTNAADLRDERPSTAQSHRSRAHHLADSRYEHHDACLNGLLAGSGPNEARWNTKRRVEQRPTVAAEGPGCLVRNGHGDIMWQSLSHPNRRVPWPPQTFPPGKWMQPPSPMLFADGIGPEKPAPRPRPASASGVCTHPTRRSAVEATAHSVKAGIEAAAMVADRAARGRGSVAPWESARNSWEAAGSGPGLRGKKRYDISVNTPGERPGYLGAASAPFGIDTAP